MLQLWKLTLAHHVVGKGKRLQRQTLSVGCVCVHRRVLASPSALRFLSFHPFLLEGWTLPGAHQRHLFHCLSMSPTDVQILGSRVWIPKPDRIATCLAPVILSRATFPPVSWLSNYFHDAVLTRDTWVKHLSTSGIPKALSGWYYFLTMFLLSLMWLSRL